MQVDPENRLVADQLEADWNEKLRILRRVHEEYEKQRETDRKTFTAEQRQKILALAGEFPKVWNDPAIAYRERKRMVRLLLEDVTLHKGDNILIQVRFKGGALRTLELPAPQPFCVTARTKPEVIEAIDRLLDDHTYEEIVEILNARGFRSGEGRVFNLSIVGRLCKKSGLKSRRQRLREAGLLTRIEMARKLKVTPLRIIRWRRAGHITGYRSNWKTEFLYEPLSEKAIAKLKNRKRNEKESE